MLPSLDIPSTMVSMVAEGEKTIAFRIWICSSTLVPLEQGLEGTLIDLRWQAMVGMEEEVMKPLFAGDGREVKLLQSCLPSFGFPLYIGKRG
jgi:hypothetical protein